MNLKLRTILITVSILLFSSCATTLKVQSDSDKEYNLSSYKTFSVIPPNLEKQDDLISINPILIQRISRSLDSVLTQKGLTKSNNADVLVKFYLGTQREVERSSDLGGYGYYGYRYFDSRDQRYVRSEKDEIAIRFHDSKTNDVVWYAFTRFTRPSDQYDQSSVNALVEEVLSSFN